MSPSVVDDAGRRLDLGAPPGRIVSLVPSLTELVCALGRGDRLVAVTRYCTDPPDIVTRLPKIGGTKTPRVGAILDLRPDLVLANSEENPRAEFEQLVSHGVQVFVSFPKSVSEAMRSISRLGTALGSDDAALGQVRRIAEALQSLPGTDTARPRVFCPIWRNPWMSFNRDTYADDVLSLAGGENVCAAEAERYPTVQLDRIAAAQPEIVLLPDEPYRFAARHRRDLAPLADTPALRRGRVHLVDGKALTWYGPRTPDALRYFRQVLAHAG